MSAGCVRCRCVFLRTNRAVHGSTALFTAVLKICPTLNAAMAVWDVSRLALQFFMSIPAVKKAKRAMPLR
jgi:hypothetical protein